MRPYSNYSGPSVLALPSLLLSRSLGFEFVVDSSGDGKVVGVVEAVGEAKRRLRGGRVHRLSVAVFLV